MENANVIGKKDRILICGLAYIILMTNSFLIVYANASENFQQSRFKAPVQPPHTQYSIQVRVNASNNRLEGREKILIHNHSLLPLKRIIIDWPYLSSEKIEIFSQDERLKSLAQGENGLSNSQILIELPRVIESEESIMLEVRFSSPLQLGKINKLTRWFPRLWWGRNTSDDFEVKIDVPEKYVIATSGIFDKARNHYSAKGVREFGIVLMRDLEILKACSGETEIYCYYEKAAGKCAELIHQTAIDAIKFYRDWLGFYPHKILHIIPGGLSHPAGGYPIATAIVGIHGQERMNEKPESHWQFITAHEIGHQYWMEHVLEAPDTFWLMIGLGVYADRAFMLAKGYGDRHERDMIQRYISGTRDMLDTRMNRLAEEREKVDFDYNNIVNHGKGFGVISALACVMGKNEFESAYRRCLKEFRDRPLGVVDFQHVCEDESGEKLDWFFDQWVRTSRFLSYEITSHETSSKNGEYVTTAKVRRLGTLSMPVPVTAFFQDNSRQCLYTDRFLDECSLVFMSKAPLKEIKLDAKDELPLIIPPPVHETAQLKKDIRNLQWTGQGDKALQIYTNNKDIDLEDTGLLFKLGMCLYDGEHYKESLQIFRKCADFSRENKSNSLFCHLTWQGHVLDLLNRRDEALKCYEEALRHCGSRTVRHDQYRMRTNRDWIEQRLKEPFQRD